MNTQYQPAQFAIGRPLAAQTLLGQVLAISAVGLLITALAAYVFSSLANPMVGLVAMLAGIGLLYAIFRTVANPALSLALFYAFAFLEGIGIAPAVGYYFHAVGPDVVIQAAATTGLGMLALACIVYATGLDLRRFQGYFTLALLGLIVVGIISLFTHWIHPATYSWLVLLIFAGLTLIDFARIRAGGDNYPPIILAVSIYLDAINIFLAILQLLGSRRSEE